MGGAGCRAERAGIDPLSAAEFPDTLNYVDIFCLIYSPQELPTIPPPTFLFANPWGMSH